MTGDPSTDVPATGRHSRSRGWRAWPPGLGAALLIGLTACAGSTGAGSPPVSPDSSAHEAETTSPQGPRDERPRDDLQDERRVEWIRYDRVGERQIRLHFLMGDPRCYGVRADVRETDADVRITLFQGSVPGAPDNCALDAAEASLLVSLRAPVGDRQVTQP